MNVAIINEKEAVNLKKKQGVVNGGGWKEER